MGYAAYSWDEDSAETNEIVGRPRPSRGAWTQGGAASGPGLLDDSLDDSEEPEVDDRAPTRAVRRVRAADLEMDDDDVTAIRAASEPTDQTHILALHRESGGTQRVNLPYGSTPADANPKARRAIASGDVIIASVHAGPTNVVPEPLPPVVIASVDSTPGPTALTPPPSVRSRWPTIGAVMGAVSLFLTVMVGVLLLLPQGGDLRIELTAPGGGQVSRAEIFVDGQKRCDSAPCIVSELPAGPRMVKVIAPGYGEAMTSTEVVEVGREKIALISLQAAPTEALAGVRVQGSQPGVRVFVDGIARGELPMRLTDLAPGLHRLAFEGERYERMDRTVDLSAGQTKDLGAVVLKVKRGRLTVELVTPGATVVLVKTADAAAGAKTEKVLPGPWPMAVELDSTKDWRVAASLPGHEDVAHDVSFSDGQLEKRVRIELPPAKTAAAAVPVESIAPVARPRAAARLGFPVRTAPAPAPAPEALSAPTSKGTLNINSLPASKVLLDGRPIGETPQVHIPLKPGVHTVTFVHPDYGRKSVSVTVQPGENATAAVRFKK